MKFIITRATFLDGLRKVQNIVSGRNTVPILQNCLIEARDAKLSLTTTDLDISIKVSLECQITEEGSTTIPVKLLSSAINEVSECDIHVSVDDNDKMSVNAGSASFKLAGMPTRDFPPLPIIEGTASFSMDVTAFNEMLCKTIYSVSPDENRRILNGLLFSFKNDKLTVAATDGRRLAIVEHEVEIPANSDTDIIVPQKTIKELIRISDKSSGQINIYPVDNQIIFEYNDIILTSKLIDGVYPNFRQVIPTDYNERVNIERVLLLQSLKRVKIMTTDETDSVRLTFSSNQLIITSGSPAIGEGRDIVPIKYDGKELAIVFQPGFLIDPLNNIDDDEIILELGDSCSPAVIKCSIPFLCVVMPIRNS